MTERAFSGWRRHDFTPIPDEFFDWVAPHLTGSEVKALLYIFRRTKGFKKDSDEISLNQMVKGLVIKGERKDDGAGLSKPTLLAALAALQRRGYIHVQRHKNPDGTYAKSTYTLRYEGEPLAADDDDEGVGQKFDQGGGRSEILPGGVGQKFDQPQGENFTNPQGEIFTNPRKTERDTARETEFSDPKGSSNSARVRAREGKPNPGPATWANPNVDAVWEAWFSSLPVGTRRERTDQRLKAITGALKRLPLEDCCDAVRGWRWDDWDGRRNSNDLMDCLRPSNIERFRDWERGINRPKGASDEARVTPIEELRRRGRAPEPAPRIEPGTQVVRMDEAIRR